MPPAIVVDDLRFRYGAADVLHGLSFDVRYRDVTGLLGPNGAGKTTTLKILAGILEPGSGRVEVEGLSLPRDAVELKRRIGYVPDGADLYESLSAVEFLQLCGGLHELDTRVLDRRIDVLLTAFELIDQRLDQLGSYSKGMRQKVLLAAALLHDPPVLLLDEPLTGLDVESVLVVKGLLAALAARGKAVIYSSHVLDVVERVCNRVLIIDRGRVVADDSPEALKTRAHEGSLEAVFSGLTHAAEAEPRVRQILDELQA
jgi:ABC-2 type transport system ATP-binding protein